MQRFLILIFLVTTYAVQAQNRFVLQDKIDHIEIPYTSASNLIILPVNFNGFDLNFILDTGASKTLLFNFSNIDSLDVKVTSVIKVRGYGKEKAFNALYSQGNKLSVNGYNNMNADIFILTDGEIDLRSLLGTDINGILGTDFFKDYIVDINYLKKKVTVSKKIRKSKRLLKKYERYDLSIYNDRPYINTIIGQDDEFTSGDLLIDTGSSDALWVYKFEDHIKKPEVSFSDYLGFGVSGDIYGERSKIGSLQLGKHILNDVLVSFPNDTTLIQKYKKGTQGSIGGEVFRRFHVIFDFKNKSLYLKNNSSFKDGFYYNMSGITLKVGNLKLFTINDSFVNPFNKETANQESASTIRISTSIKVIYKYVPEIYIDYLRPDSPALKAGMQVGDKIISVNNKSQAQLNINDINGMFYRNPYTTLKFTVDRNGEKLNFKITLKPVI